VRVRYTRPAIADLEAVLGAISSNSPQGARRVRSRIQTFIELLADHPFIGARTDDPSIRRLPVPPYPYLVFYEVGEHEAIIHTVRNAARDPSSMPGSG
jgi:toxin ParE1/3/4